MAEQLLTAALPGIPIAGGVLAAAIPGSRRTLLAGSAALLTSAAILWLACTLAGTVTSPVSLSGGSWLVIPSTDGITVRLLVQADRPRVLLILVAAFVVLLECVQLPPSGDDTKSELIDVSLLLPLSVLAILAADLVVLVSVWILLDCCVYRSCRQGDCSANPKKRNFETELVLSVASILLLLATLTATARFGTTSLAKIVSRAILDNRIDSTAVVSGLSVLFIAAAAVRCAFFPVLVWPRNCLRTQPFTAGRIVVLAGILPGISLAIETLPLREISAEGCQLLALLGVLTCLTATGIALVQNGPTGISTLLSIGAAGLSTVAFGTMHPVAGEVAACTLFAQVVAVLVLKHRKKNARSHIVTGLAMVVAVSGIGGGNAILLLIETTLRNTAISDNSVALPSESQLQLMWWGVVASQLLWGLAVVRLVSWTSRAGSLKQPDDKYTRTTARPTSQTALMPAVAALAAGACILPLGDATDADVVSPIMLLSFGAATPACLLGAVIGWLLAQTSDSVRDRIAAVSDSLSRLCREWFYLEDYIRYGFALPTRIAAIIAENIDRKFLGGTSEDGWKQTPSHLADMIEQQRRQPAIYYGLTGVLIVVGSLWSVF